MILKYAVKRFYVYEMLTRETRIFRRISSVKRNTEFAGRFLFLESK